MLEPQGTRGSRVAYFDCYSGISGDMALGALVDAGLDAELLRSELARLGLPGLELRIERAQRRGMAGTHVRVLTGEVNPPRRRLADIESIVGGSPLPAEVRDRAIAVFRRLARAEAAVHGIGVEEVHFHEVGAVDAIADVVGFAIGMHHLGIDQCYASSLPMGHGMVQTLHGALPLPAPATLALLADVGAPIHHVDVEAELVTPTGAALLASSATFERPPMQVQRVGVGLGTRELPWPNALRLWLGEASTAVSAAPGAAAGLDEGESVVLETNLDDATPEEVAYAMERLFAAGALDVYVTPTHMKKNRPGVLLTVLAMPDMAGALARVILRETSTLGVRFYSVQRVMCPRRFATVETPFGTLGVKLKLIDGMETVCPEYEECARAAREHNVPIREVYTAVLAGEIIDEDDAPTPTPETSGGGAPH